MKWYEMKRGSDHTVATTLLLPLLLLLLYAIQSAEAYHEEFSNTQFHCWLNVGANKTNDFDCQNVNFVWVQDPPKDVEKGKPFNVSYELRFPGNDPTEFFQWLIDNKWTHLTTTEEVTEFCNAECGYANDARADNCCVHHINIHSCPDESIKELNDMCGPWIQPQGTVFTHTPSLATNITRWTTEVVLTNLNHNWIIAHIRVGEIQMALGWKIYVYKPADCGDDYCDTRTESCATCKKDCCPGLKLEILIVIIVISALLFFFAFVLIPCVWYYQKRKFLYDETWIISWDSIKASTGYKGFGSVRSIASTMLSQTSLGGQNGGINPPPVRGQIFCDTGIFAGKLVSIKKVHKNQFQLNRSLRVEIRNVRALDHINLATFYGIVTEIENFSIITEYCNKGSLNDVLLNDGIPLNWGFRLSFASDICRGMEYLHNHKMFHGRLKSSNCIIDDRWVCKITDYGLPTVRLADTDPEIGENFSSLREKRINRVYRPPEAIQDEAQLFTAATDVYSFSIILVEIGGRTEISPPEETVYDPSWRPELPDLECSDEDPDNSLPMAFSYIDLIKHCWEDRPGARPTFTDIKKQLHMINPNKENPVDTMMKLMEKYSKHLEAMVTERTEELVEEKKKTDRLLYAMLPKAVAEDLKQGNPILAEKYDACTIFFSDIVGFTHLSSSSTPIEVVELLNQMYTAFDSIIDEHDVYKVETIGDAYMVVSGVPNRNGDEHAAEIATMALKIVCFCRGFRVPHRPEQIVNIRAGIHSGPVVTCVVGLKMPRFCLFGDTVNMASRMESTGEALKIQVSPDTHVILKENPEFTFEYRGHVAVKGKGSKETHWLTGRKDLHINSCLSPGSHKRIFKGNKHVPPPNPLTPTSPRVRPEFPAIAPSAPPSNGLPSASSPPPYNTVCNGANTPNTNGANTPNANGSSPFDISLEETPFLRGASERESTTSRDHLLDPAI